MEGAGYYSMGLYWNEYGICDFHTQPGKPCRSFSCISIRLWDIEGLLGFHVRLNSYRYRELMTGICPNVRFEHTRCMSDYEIRVIITLVKWSLAYHYR